MRATERGDDSDTGGAGSDADAGGDGRRALRRWYPLALALAGSVAVLVANVGGIAIGDDGIGYQATADSLLAGDGLGYFLERPLTVWPPVWPWLMAAVAKVTPLDTLGAAVALNVVMTFLAVIVGHRLLVRVVRQERLVLLGTAVIALGSSTIGFGHLLMTDFAFGVLIMVWILALLNFQASGRWAFLVGAAGLVWVGFGLRYVGIVLVGIGGLWLLLDREHRVLLRVRNAAVFGVVSILAPVAWMARNHSVDGTYTGERVPVGPRPVRQRLRHPGHPGPLPPAGRRQRLHQDLGRGGRRGPGGGGVAGMEGLHGHPPTRGVGRRPQAAPGGGPGRPAAC